MVRTLIAPAPQSNNKADALLFTGLTEEQITEIFSAAGRVVNLRLVYDRETGRPKGFGFAEFPDYDSAASAVRNLNDHEVMGRKLRVDFSSEQATTEDDRDRAAAASASNPQSYNPQPTNGAGAQPSGGSSTLPPLPQGQDLPPGMSCTDAISRTLNTLPPAQLLDTLQQVQAMATNDPARLTELFHQAPQLSYAVFQAMLLLGLVRPEAINSVLENPADAAAPPPAPAAQPYGGYPGATGTPPVAGDYYPPPVVPSPVPNAPVAAPPAPQGQDPEALMRAVMELPQETIDQLPEAERAQIMALRASYGHQARR
ncbi:hinge domain of cleavage stimulation factor subunit 2-domain-containing protein [Echria macrotheca]|uniref:Hinge domain of cleavage stimulation factor subunit 2-domain-containing protein n=1 Tax=Echria macrotheca TaxID=438768 RepID=A0AAJ0BBR0_9PEZI|nr:hinge domain of cleavage stimulation factor subunit 2-domain-containing protein [Echria macrotheca]